LRRPAIPIPTTTQLAFLRHLVTTGRPWRSEPIRPRLLTGRPRRETRPRLGPDFAYRLSSGHPVKITTVRCAIDFGWLLAIGSLGHAEGMAVITPAGRAVLQRFEPDRPSGWDDEDRIRLREPGPGICRGPVEVEECGEHPGELEAYRWTWARPGDPSIIANHLQYVEAGEAEIVARCPECRREYERASMAELRAVGAGR
jgi:hypothetical protein